MIRLIRWYENKQNQMKKWEYSEKFSPLAARNHKTWSFLGSITNMACSLSPAPGALQVALNKHGWHPLFYPPMGQNDVSPPKNRSYLTKETCHFDWPYSYSLMVFESTWWCICIHGAWTSISWWGTWMIAPELQTWNRMIWDMDMTC